MVVFNHLTNSGQNCFAFASCHVCLPKLYTYSMYNLCPRKEMELALILYCHNTSDLGP